MSDTKPSSAAPASLPSCMTGPSEPCAGYQELEAQFRVVAGQRDWAFKQLRASPPSSTRATSAWDMQEALRIMGRLADIISATPREAYKDWVLGDGIPYDMVRVARDFIALPRNVHDLSTPSSAIQAPKPVAWMWETKHNRGLAWTRCAPPDADEATITPLYSAPHAELERRANAYPKLVQALRKTLELAEMQCACLGFDKTPVQADAEAVLHELGDK